MLFHLCKHRNLGWMWTHLHEIELFVGKTEVAPAFSATARQKERAGGSSQLSPLERKQEEKQFVNCFH